MLAIDAALGDAAQSPRPGADPFSLGDADATAGLLDGAGFDGIRFEDVRDSVPDRLLDDARLLVTELVTNCAARSLAADAPSIRGDLGQQHRAPRGPRSR